MNRFTPADIKDRVVQERALVARAVRQFIISHPGCTSYEINQAVHGGGWSLGRLKRLGAIREQRVGSVTHYYPKDMTSK